MYAYSFSVHVPQFVVTCACPNNTSRVGRVLCNYIFERSIYCVQLFRPFSLNIVYTYILIGKPSAGNNTEGSVSRSQATPVMSPTVIPTMMNYTTHSNKQIISVSIIVASLLVIGTGTMMIILLVIFLVRSQSEIRTLL